MVGGRAEVAHAARPGHDRVAIATAAERRETHEVPRYAYELASAFSAFYRDCKVLTDDPDLTAARLALVDATRRVLANALDLLGISAPDQM